VYRQARGFVLLSAMESLSLSALEAAACECPLLLSRLSWATTYFRESACYCPITSSAARTAAFLRQFYDAAPGLKPPPKPLTWLEVGQQLKRIYETLLSTS
jgi:glycosyltransferase involved in cell wall biosynthesis